MPSFLDSVKGAVSSGAEATGNVTSKVASSNIKVATSIFETGARDAITVVDQFGKRVVSEINQQTAGLKGKFDSFLSNSKIFSLTRDTIKSITATTNAALKAVNSAKKQIESYTGLNLSSVGAAKDSLKNAAITTLSNVTGYDARKIMRDTDEVMRIFSGADTSSVNGLFNTANRLLGTTVFSNIVDTRAESALLGSLLTEAGKLGVVKLFDDLWFRVKTNDEQSNDNISFYSAANAISTVVLNGDLDMLENLVDKLGGPSILSTQPTVLTDFLRHYHVDYEEDVPAYLEIRTRIDGVFSKINPEWSLLTIAESPVYRLDPFLSASKDVYAIFTAKSTDPEGIATAQSKADPITVAAIIAQRYPRRSGTALLRSYYPNIPYA